MSVPLSDEQKQLRLKALDATLDWSKQLAALAAAAILLSGTFMKEVFRGPIHQQAAIVLSWIAMTLSLLCGLLLFQVAIARLSDFEEVDAYSAGTRILAGLQLASFLAGLGLFMWFVRRNL